VTPDAFAEAKAAMERGDAEAARGLIDRALAERPQDPEIRALYSALHLGRAVRLAAEAREARRRDIVQRDIPYEEEFHDSPEVAKAFDAALEELEAVLRVEPGHEKALMTKALVLFRRDREQGRPRALEILGQVQAANPRNRQVLAAMRKIEKPCPRCGDTGFCSACRARGTRRFLGFERRCDACHGQGICLACGVL